MLEKTVETFFVKAVKAAGGEAYKFASPAQRGVPDRIVILNGAVFFAELKAPGKTPTAYQRREHDRIRRAGGLVVVIDHPSQINFILDQFKK